MQGLSELEQHEVGYVDYVVDGPEAYRKQPVLKPLRRRGRLHVPDGDSRIFGSPVTVEHLHIKAAGLSFTEIVDGRPDELAGYVAELQICVEVACHSPMGRRVDPVGGDFIFDYGLGLKMQVFLGGSAHHRVGRKHHDTFMSGTYAQLVLGAYHTERLHAPDLGLLYLEVSGKHGPDLRKKDFLPGRHVRRTADHGKGLARTVIDLGDMQMVRIRMVFAFQHFRHDDSGKSAGNLFLLLHPVNLDAYRSHGIRYLLRGQLAFQIILEPIVTEFHIFSNFISNHREKKASPRTPACRRVSGRRFSRPHL